ncbi:amidase [Sulfitobacter sp.]|uniref:amidase n=1 Tax=Sulfitobacter sp. TaxID=1903071 RepID=UPI003002DD17
MRDYPNDQNLQDLQERYHLFAHMDAAIIDAERDKACPEGPLQDLVVGLKANIASIGANWSAGLRHRIAITAQSDAHLTKRLRDHGARILPGLNMDAAALGGGTDNPDLGRTANPHAPDHSAGGSSGGSAAAVATGLCDVAIGTDTLGSIRIPASYCGVFGLKPTFGLIGRSGIVPLAPSLDTVGILTARAGDVWPVLQALAGPDGGDTDSQPAPAQWANQTATPDAQGLRIGIPQQVSTVECTPETLVALASARTTLEQAGAHVETIDMPEWNPAKLRQKAFLMTEAEGAATFAEALGTAGTLPRTVERLLTYGSTLSAAKLVAGMAEIRAARVQLARSFAQVDVLLMPTTPQRAFQADAPAPANQADFTALANAGGVPALAVPIEVAGQALPASVQLVGPAWSEPRLIRLAMVLESAF